MGARPKLTIDQQLQWMKAKGITFNIYSEQTAADFLRNNTYFFKLKSFNKDFILNPKTNLYLGLDFAYLVELSTLDMHLRRLILHATLDIEHFLKVRLISHLSDNPAEDGYDVMQRLFCLYPRIKDKILHKDDNSMCKDLILKIQREEYPVWNVIEVLSFGDFLRLYSLYDQNNGGKDQDLLRCLYSVRCLRNAAAHNNCLLNSLQSPYTRKIRPSQRLSHFISTVPGTGERTQAKKMKNPVVHDFVALLYVYREVVSSPRTVEHFCEELHDLFDRRMLKHADYFQKNECVTSTYQFIKKTIGYLYPFPARHGINTP